MRIFCGHLQLLDYVFYATVERGKIYETGAFIHNYALAYALQLVRHVPYTRLKQEPRYAEELSPLNDFVYISPGTPRSLAHRLVQWNTVREGYGFPGKPPSLGYPDWGFARVLRPESQFTLYLFLSDENAIDEFPTLRDLSAGKSVRIRLGKFMGKASLKLEPATKIDDKEGAFTVSTLLNWRDLPVDPFVSDVVATSLPTRLLNNASFAESAYYQVSFGEETIDLPAGMRFLSRLPDKKKAR
jgi:CRISPR-associated protein Csc1